MKILYKDILDEKNFTFLLLGRLFKRSSLILFSLELIWLTMELTSSSPLYLSLMVMAETLPFIFLGIYGGVKADKWNKKKIMVICDLLIAILILSIPVMFFLGFLNYFILMCIAVLISILNCFSEPSFRALLPELVTNNKLQRSNALLDSIQRGASIIIPASVGIVVKVTDQIHILTLAFILISISGVFHMLINYKVTHLNTNDSEQGTIAEIKLTLAYLKSHRNILFIIFVQGISILINTGLWRVGLPIYLDTNLGKDISTFGIITGILGAAAFSTSIILGTLKKLNPIVIFKIGIILWGSGLLLIGLSPSIFVIYIATIIIGIGQASEGLGRIIIIQEQVPGNMLGKVFSISSSINYTSDTLSLGVISSILAIFTTSSVFLGGGGIILIIGLMGFMFFKKEK
ncbi:MFS transporter [Lysinibacillus sp. G4S2]|uniref:MFS transporter n=1 Tax=Lysinibacillus sp. G4S2 TaxID=3055859 RepID=UPI0025A0A1A4|nr:MFS transporter [Lysinibacillus sp. G4S2]MDM5247281.1 MFS transporter [Lysinibacillus sp. G4S2]